VQRELLVASVKDGSKGLIEVRDSGAGLHSTALDRLFEAFYFRLARGLRQWRRELVLARPTIIAALIKTNAITARTPPTILSV